MYLVFLFLPFLPSLYSSSTEQVFYYWLFYDMRRKKLVGCRGGGKKAEEKETPRLVNLDSESLGKRIGCGVII